LASERDLGEFPNILGINEGDAVIKRKNKSDIEPSQVSELGENQDQALEADAPDAISDQGDLVEELEVVAEGEGEDMEGDPRDVSVEERVDALLEEIERLQKQSSEYLDGWQRERAEFANFKNRTSREKEEARSRISSEIIAKYLGIVDDLELAISNRPLENETEAWADGIELIHGKLKAILTEEGVEMILAEGVTFDPNFHEAITYEENDDHQDGQVIEVVQKGYKLGDRVLRPAKVRVAK
jgi:molecular chaperone GrpE